MYPRVRVSAYPARGYKKSVRKSGRPRVSAIFDLLICFLSEHRWRRQHWHRRRQRQRQRLQQRLQLILLARFLCVAATLAAVATCTLQLCVPSVNALHLNVTVNVPLSSTPSCNPFYSVAALGVVLILIDFPACCCFIRRQCFVLFSLWEYVSKSESCSGNISSSNKCWECNI